MINTKAFIEQNLKIRDKKARLIDFKLNAAQMKLYNAIAGQYRNGRPIRAIILKARQMGFSTLTEGMIFKDTVTQANISSGIVTHEIAATNNLFRMSKRYYEHLDPALRPQILASNAKELVFDFADGNSSIKCMTAGNGSIGRSDTFQNLHISEYAFWPKDKAEILTGLLQAVPNEANTMVVIESTANGYDDFKDIWDAAVAGRNDFVPVFCAWWEHAEYAMPAEGLRPTKEEARLKRAYGLSDEQIAWRRWCLKNNCRGNEDIFRQEYPSCPEEAFLMSGRPVFDNKRAAERIAELTKRQAKRPPVQGSFRIRWHDADSRDRIEGFSLGSGTDIRFYIMPKPGVPYVIGADTKGEGKDFYAATVIDNSSGERVATLHMQVNESKPFTHQLYCLGKYYNDALIGVEMNFNTAPIEELQRLRYPKQYVRRRYDDYKKTIEEKYGWKTDGNTRPLIIDREVDSINNHTELYSDIPTLREALTFVYDDNGRPDAIAGKHDDLLFSDMIANEIRSQQRTTKDTNSRGEYVQWTDDMFEDYYGANEAQKKKLLKLWGEPKRWR
ncbi:hypothetical protein [Christensenella tenuis]|uniref:Terminase n=1 Tax=Christensenella tenuis TaxID=2763033 RepID=A0ABR7EEQ7_9FIRM|nr:hypothetical protein [Christensenella tenuis]MBC5648267.1 hypothetical protein [Christensenella tenuis]